MKVYEASLGSLGATTDHLKGFRAMTRKAGQDDAGALAAANMKLGNILTADQATMTTSLAKGKIIGNLDSDETVTVASNGAITWGNVKLDLKGIANVNDERNLIVQRNTDGTFNVYRGTTDDVGYSLTSSGKADRDSYGNIKAASNGSTWDTTRGALIVNNGSASGSTINGGAGADMIVNRQAGVTVNGGAANDMIFNYSKAATILGGAGDDAVYSVGLEAGGSIDTGDDTTNDEGYVKLISNMTGGSITMGKGKNIIDATGMTISGAAIADRAGAKATVMHAKTVSGGTVNFAGASTGLDVSSLEGTAAVTFGTGANSLVADTLKNATVNSTGTDSFQFKDVLADGKVDSNGSTKSSVINITGSAKGATFNLGSNVNTINAAGRTLTSVNITDKTTTSTTAIIAGSITGTGTARSSIALEGTGTVGSGVDVKGAINFTDIDTKTGKGTVTAGSLADSTLTMGGTGTETQSVTVNGNMTRSSITTGAGDDTIDIKGSVSGTGTIAMGAGANSFKAGKAVSDLTFTGGADADVVEILGSVAKSSFALGDGANSFTAKNGTKGQAVTDTSITSSGTGATSVTAGALKSSALNKDILLAGSGANTVTLDSITATTAAAFKVTLGAATDTADQELTVNGAVKGLNYAGGDGIDSITINGAIADSKLVTGDGANTVTTGAAKNLTYTGGAGVDSIAITGAVTDSSFEIGDGNNIFSAVKGTAGQAMSNVNIIATSGTGNNSVTAGAYTVGRTAATNNTIDLGTGGTNSVTLGSIASGTVNKLEVKMGANDASLTVAGAVKNLDFTSGAGNDTINITGAVTDSKLVTGNGTNTVTTGAAKNLTYTGGDNADVLQHNGAVTGSIIDLGKGANTFEASITKNSVKAYQAVTGVAITTDAASTSNTINIGAAKALGFTGGDGADVLNINGAVVDSTIDLGKGSNSVTASITKGSVTTNQAMTNVNITASSDTATDVNTVTAGAYTVGKAADNTISLGVGINTVNFNSIAGNKAYKLNMTLGGAGSTAAQALNVKGAVSNLAFTGALGAGISTVNAEGVIRDSSFAVGTGTTNSITASVTKNSKTTNYLLTNVTTTVGAAGGLTVKGSGITTSGVGGKSDVQTGVGKLDLSA